MPNHIHVLLRTPEPNLGSGMQHWLSGYANWYAKRNRRTGHLFQGRYFRSQAAGREIVALLCRRLTSSTLAELSEAFGLRHPDSSANLVRRAKKREAESTKYRRQVKDLESKLMPKTENQT